VSTPVYRDPTTLKVVPFVTAGGEVLFTAFIFKHEERADKKTFLRRWFDFDAGRAPRRKDRHLYCKTWTSKTGFVNKTTWRQIMAAFVAAARKRHHPGLLLSFVSAPSNGLHSTQYSEHHGRSRREGALQVGSSLSV
jgi:hypothetical protein